MNYSNEKYETMLIYVDTTTNAGEQPLYQVNLSGKYKVKLVGVSLQFSTDPAIMRVQFVSPQLQIPYGNSRYPVAVYPYAAHNDASYDKVYCFEGYYDGTMTLKVIDASTGVAPVNFSFAYLTFEVMKLE
jgi:hypothetical protein